MNSNNNSNDEIFIDFISKSHINGNSFRSNFSNELPLLFLSIGPISGSCPLFQFPTKLCLICFNPIYKIGKPYTFGHFFCFDSLVKCSKLS